MRRLHPMVLAAVLLGWGIYAAGPLAAQPEATLAWDDCVFGGGTADKADACNSNTGSHKLVIGVQPHGLIENVNGAQGIIDIRTDAATLPDFWQFQAGGGARFGALTSDPNIGGSSPPFGCANPWASVGNTSAAVSFTFPLAFGTHSGRFSYVVAIPGLTTLDSSVSPEFNILAINISRAGTTTTSGCAMGACIALNQLRLTQPAEHAPDEFACLGDRSFVTWQGGTSVLCPGSLRTGQEPSCPGPTPVRTSTWGSVKGLYR